MSVAEADLDLAAICSPFERVMRVGVTDPMRARIEITTGIEQVFRSGKHGGPREKPPEYLPYSVRGQ